MLLISYFTLTLSHLLDAWEAATHRAWLVFWSFNFDNLGEFQYWVTLRKVKAYDNGGQVRTMKKGDTMIIVHYSDCLNTFLT